MERRWLIGTVATGVVIGLSLFGFALMRESGKPGFNSESSYGLFILVSVWSVPITLFLVGIPARIGMNLFVRDRRKTHWKETLVLVFSLAALGWMFYSLFAYPASG